MKDKIKLEDTASGISGRDPDDRLLRYKSNIRKSYFFTVLMSFHLISGILLPFFMEWGGLTFFEVMLIQGFFTLMILVFEIPCGAISDYFSRRLSLILGAVGHLQPQLDHYIYLNF